MNIYGEPNKDYRWEVRQETPPRMFFGYRDISRYLYNQEKILFFSCFFLFFSVSFCFVFLFLFCTINSFTVTHRELMLEMLSITFAYEVLIQI